MTLTKRINSLLLAVSLGLFLNPASATESQPPAAMVICQNLERLWSQRRYAELDRYVGALHKEWKDYAPVALTLAVYSKHYGGQIEDSITILRRLRERLGADIEAASPLFLDLLDGRIDRYE